MDNPVNLQQVDVNNIQDPDFNAINEQYPANNDANYINLQLAPVAIENQPAEQDDMELPPDKIDEIESNQFAPKTKKQTLWGVKKFRGMCKKAPNYLKVKKKVIIYKEVIFIGDVKIKRTTLLLQIQISDWLFKTGRDPNFEQASKEVLAATLRIFYPSIKQANGKPYQKQTLINLRSSINRHLSLPPHHKNWDLITDPAFKSANTVFTGNLRLQKKLGNHHATSRTPLARNHIQKIYDTYLIPHFDNDPRCLMHKVFMDLCYFMGR